MDYSLYSSLCTASSGIPYIVDCLEAPNVGVGAGCLALNSAILRAWSDACCCGVVHFQSVFRATTVAYESRQIHDPVVPEAGGVSGVLPMGNIG